MAKTRNIALNASGGAQVVVKLTIPARRVEIIEDEATTPQGLIWQDIMDNFVATKQCSPSIEPIFIQLDQNPQTGGRGRLLGFGPQTDDHGAAWGATKVWQGTSAGAAATTIRVTEYEA